MQNNVALTALTYTREEAAQVAKVSLPTLDAWLSRADFPAFKAGRRWIIPVDKYKAWLETKAAAREMMPGV